MRRISLKTYLKREAARLARRDGQPFSTSLVLADAEDGRTRCFYPLLLLKICEGGSRAEKLMAKVQRDDLRREGASALAALKDVEDVESAVLAGKVPKTLPREFSKQLESWRCLYFAPETAREAKADVAARLREAVARGACAAHIAEDCSIDPGNLSAFASGDLSRLGKASSRRALRWLAANGFLNGQAEESEGAR